MITGSNNAFYVLKCSGLCEILKFIFELGLGAFLVYRGYSRGLNFRVLLVCVRGHIYKTEYAVFWFSTWVNEIHTLPLSWVTHMHTLSLNRGRLKTRVSPTAQLICMDSTMLLLAQKKGGTADLLRDPGTPGWSLHSVRQPLHFLGRVGHNGRRHPHYLRPSLALCPTLVDLGISKCNQVSIHSKTALLLCPWHLP